MPRPATHRAVPAVLLALALGGVTAGCSDGERSTEVRTIEVTVAGGQVTPENDRIEVDRDQPVDVVVTADEPGSLHIHATPEFSRDFAGGGETTTIKLQFDRPGEIEIETHEPEQLIATLVVK